MNVLRIETEGMGIWGKKSIEIILRKVRPNLKIVYTKNNEADIVLRSHFLEIEPTSNRTPKPYIYWSGESYRVPESKYATHHIHINSFLDRESDIYYPYLLENLDHLNFKSQDNDKEYLLAYCNSNCIKQREKFFNYVCRFNRKSLNTIHSLGKCFGTYKQTQKKIDGNGVSFNELRLFSKYKFIIAMENKIAPGYITEKIVNAFSAGAIPIYWGDKSIYQFFNQKSFINISEFRNFKECAKYISSMSESEYVSIKQEPPILADSRLYYFFSNDFKNELEFKLQPILKLN